MNKLIMTIGIIVFTIHAFADNVVDLYGESPQKSAQVVDQYAQEVGDIESRLQTSHKKNPSLFEQDKINAIVLKRNLLAEKIKSELDALYVKFDTVLYPGNENIYTTIEVINKDHPDRLRLTDGSDSVRKNVLLAVQNAVKKAPLKQVDMTPLFTLLDSPYAVDRNQSLSKIYQLVDSKSLSRIIAKKVGDKLIELLMLKQPNNHDLAYSILKKISGQDFGAENSAAWKSWLVSLDS